MHPLRGCWYWGVYNLPISSGVSNMIALRQCGFNTYFYQDKRYATEYYSQTTP